MDRFSEVDSEALLVAEISADYPEKPGVLQRVSFALDRAEILGLIGPSGSGKSTIALAVPRLLELRGGRIRGRIQFCGRDLMTCDARALRHIRGREIGFVPQSPMSALNPALRIETHLKDGVVRGNLNVGFTLGLMLKDVRLACKLGSDSGVPMLYGSLTREFFQM
jgi:ABC-type glutathione transport system ATPase component